MKNLLSTQSTRHWEVQQVGQRSLLVIKVLRFDEKKVSTRHQGGVTKSSSSITGICNQERAQDRGILVHISICVECIEYFDVVVKFLMTQRFIVQCHRGQITRFQMILHAAIQV